MAKTDVSGPFSAILLLVVVCFIVAIPQVSAITSDYTGYWKFEELTGVVLDELYLNNGTNSGAIRGEIGFIGNAFYYKNTDTVTLDNAGLPTGVNDDFSLCMWYNVISADLVDIFSQTKWGTGRVYININGVTNKIRLSMGGTNGDYGDYNVNEWNFVCLIRDSGNVSMWNNGVYQSSITKTDAVDNNPSIFGGVGHDFNGFIDEIGIWDRSLTPAEISNLYNDALVTLESPQNESIFSGSEINFTISGYNISTLFANWTNVTYNVWNSTSLFNSTTVNFIDNETFNQTLLISDFPFGNYEWNAEACYTNVTGTYCIESENNNSFSVGATVSSSIFNNNTYETSSEIFEIVVELVEGSQLSLARLIYNGTNYNISNISSSNNTYTLTRIIDIPLINSTYQSNSFYWSFIYNGGETQTLGSNSQNVSSIFLSQCNATYTTQSLSFIYFDELNQTLLNAMTYPTSLLLNFKYWLGSGDIKKTYTFQELSSSLNSFQFCISENETFYTDMDLQYYTATDYSERSYYFRNYTLNNVSNDITLYTLLKTEATKFSINIKQGVNVFPDTVVAVWKYFVGLGNYRVVMIGLTDDKGKFSANLDLDQSYNFTINKNNYDYGGFLKQATCLESPCEIDINIEELALSGFADLLEYFAQNIEITDESLWNNRTSKMVSVDFMDKLGTASYWRLWVYMNNYNNDSVITICDEKEYASTGTLSCNYSAYSGDIVAKLYISRSPEKLVEFINFVNTNAPEIFGTSAILASIIILCVILFSGTVNPVIALVEIPFALVILKFIGFIPFDWSWIAGLTIFILWIAHKVNT